MPLDIEQIRDRCRCKCHLHPPELKEEPSCCLAIVAEAKKAYTQALTEACDYIVDNYLDLEADFQQTEDAKSLLMGRWRQLELSDRD